MFSHLKSLPVALGAASCVDAVIASWVYGVFASRVDGVVASRLDGVTASCVDGAVASRVGAAVFSGNSVSGVDMMARMMDATSVCGEVGTSVLCKDTVFFSCICGMSVIKG